MPPTTPPAPAARFARLIGGLCAAVAARVGRPARPGLAGPLIILIWTRLQRMAARVARLAARVEAGTLTPPRRRKATQRPAGAPCQRLPGGFAWLVRLVPATAFGAEQLRALLDDPEMKTLIAAAPRIGRTLRPLCRALGVRPPPVLQPPEPTARSPAGTGRPRAAHPRPVARRPHAPAPAPEVARSACGPPVPA